MVCGERRAGGKARLGAAPSAPNRTVLNNSLLLLEIVRSKSYYSEWFIATSWNYSTGKECRKPIPRHEHNTGKVYFYVCSMTNEWNVYMNCRIISLTPLSTRIICTLSEKGVSNYFSFISFPYNSKFYSHVCIFGKLTVGLEQDADQG